MNFDIVCKKAEPAESSTAKMP